MAKKSINSLPSTTVSPLIGKRRSVLFWITLITIICGFLIGLKPDNLFSNNSLKLATEFFKASISPAIDYENPVEGTEPFLKVVVESILITLRFAILAMSVSVPIGAILAFLSTTAWWPENINSTTKKSLLRTLHIIARSWIAFARSIHERSREDS